MRRLRSLVVGLDEHAVVWRSETRERAGEWTTTEHLLALAVEKIHQVVQWQNAAIPRPRGQYRPIPPLHIQRPGEKKKTVTPAGLFRMMIGGDT